MPDNTAAHDRRCISHTGVEDGCDCAVWAMIDGSPDLRQWVRDAYDSHGQALWWKRYARADDEKRAQMRLLAAIDGMVLDA